jgi:hypothetical protein
LSPIIGGISYQMRIDTRLLFVKKSRMIYCITKCL